MPAQVVADVRLPAAVEVSSAPNRMATPCGAQRSAASRTTRLAVVEARVAIGRVARIEVDVVGDGQISAMPRSTRMGGVDIDGDGAVRRLVGVEVGVERQVAAWRSVAGAARQPCVAGARFSRR